MLGWALVAGIAACTPVFPEQDASLRSPTLLELHFEPAELAPGQLVKMSLRFANAQGYDTSSKLAFCSSRLSLGDPRSVSTECATGAAIQLGETKDSLTARVPADACRIYGPDPPPDGGQAVAADRSGGYFQPVRVYVFGHTSLAFLRLKCGWPEATKDQLAELAKSYQLNKNPPAPRLQLASGESKLEEVLLAPAVSAAAGAGGGSDQVSSGALQLELGTVRKGAKLRLLAELGAESQENYVMIDPSSLELVQRREELLLDWRSSGPGLGDTYQSIDSDNQVTTQSTELLVPSKVGTYFVWLLLRDGRGGTNLTEAQLVVAD